MNNFITYYYYAQDIYRISKYDTIIIIFVSIKCARKLDCAHFKSTPLYITSILKCRTISLTH